MVAVEPRPELGQMFDDAGGSGKPRVGQIAMAYDLDEQAALRRARDQFRWFTAGWRVNAELPLPASFDVASIPEVELVAAHAPGARMAFMHPVKSRVAISARICACR